MVRTPHFHCGGHGFIPGWGIKIPHAARHGQKKNFLTQSVHLGKCLDLDARLFHPSRNKSYICEHSHKVKQHIIPKAFHPFSVFKI